MIIDFYIGIKWQLGLLVSSYHSIYFHVRLSRTQFLV